MTAALFQPFRALGYITDDVPFCVQRRGKETYVTLSVGKAWQVYDCAKLRLVLVGPQLKSSITALACKGDLTFAACGSGDIVACKRVHRVGVYRLQSLQGSQGRILQLLVLGDFLLSLAADGKLLVWKIGEYEEPEVEMQLPSSFVPTHMVHPDTYVNKVLLGSTSGRLQLWNFSTVTLLYEFPGWGSAITALAASPALDVVGVGLADGRAVLHNIRYDEEVMTLANAAGMGTGLGPLLPPSASGKPAVPAVLGAGGGTACSCLSFSSGAGTPLLAAGGPAGVVTVWALEARKLHALIKQAHDGPLVNLHFFAGEPLLMSAGSDNAVKQWVFDNADGSARLLRFRGGHSAPPSVVQFYGDASCLLLSAGQDRAFRMFSTIQDHQSRELSQQHSQRRAKRLKVREAEVKLPRVVCAAACQVRERDWANAVTGHYGDPTAYTWRLQHYTLGQHALEPPGPAPDAPPHAPVSAVAVSCCGNFGLVASRAGRLDRYNLQSGLHRGEYRCGAASAQLLAAAAHSGAVVGVASDSCNKQVVSVGRDGKLRIWGFKSRKLLHDVSITGSQDGSGLSVMAYHNGSGLVAVALQSGGLRIYDAGAAGRLVRRFSTSQDRITDLEISADSSWLLASSMDGLVSVWDIPNAQCLQVMKMGAAVAGMSLSSTQDLLATVHAGHRGIFLWTNQLVFGTGLDLVPSTTPVDVRMPSVTSGTPAERDSEQLPGSSSSSGSDGSDDSGAVLLDPLDDGTDADSGAAAPAETSAAYRELDASGSPVPLVPEMVTLSLLPATQWQSLCHMDAIKERSRPVKPPEKPATAPFFLPTIPSVSGQPQFDVDRAGNGSGDGGDGGSGEPGQSGRSGSRIGGSNSSRIGKGLGPSAVIPEFQKLLQDGAASGDYSRFLELLRRLSPAVLDREVRALEVLDLDADGGTDLEELQPLLQLFGFFQAQLATNTNFDFLQGLLGLVLQVHGEAIMAHEKLREAARDVAQQLQASWTKLEELLLGTRCMLGFVANLQGV